MNLRQEAERIVEMFPGTGHRDGDEEAGRERDIREVEEELRRIVETASNEFALKAIVPLTTRLEKLLGGSTRDF